MTRVFIILGLGLAGIDPLGLAVVLAAIAAGGSKPHVVAFCVASFLATVSLGVLFSFFGEQLSHFVSSFVPDDNDPSWAFVELVAAALIFYWLVSHLRQRDVEEEPDPAKAPASSVLGITVSGMAFSLSALPDPTFLAVVALASQATSVMTMVAYHSLWVLVSQLPLFGFAVAFLLGVHQPLMDRARPIWDKVKRPIIFLFMISLGALAALLAFDAVAFLLTGAYPIPI
ncbi:MAG: hypothetical protein CR993_00750 [Rhodobacterales bacterium]|nr:MAG: hypothetical protein CR993_00750 [Rhodobacterales bacterium]